MHNLPISTTAEILSFFFFVKYKLRQASFFASSWWRSADRTYRFI